MARQDFVPVPVDSLNWKTIEDYVMNTPLGTHACRADVLDSDLYVILKPGEDERLEKLQVQIFCDWIIETKGIILGPQMKYLLEIFGLTQSVLADAAQISQSAISQLVTGATRASKQTSRELAIMFRIESGCRGFLAALGAGKWMDEWGHIPHPVTTGDVEQLTGAVQELGAS